MVCRFDISMTTINQHAAQAAFQHQFHLFGDHCRVVNFQRREQFMGEVMCCLFADRLTDGSDAGIGVKRTGGDEQTAGIAIIAHAFGQCGVARQ